MNVMSISSFYRWLAAIAALAFCGTFLLWSRLVWTPVQRYYLRAYLSCSWPGTDPASSSKIRWIYKTAPGEKQELAWEDDAIPAASSADRTIGMELSPEARQVGWTALMERPEERLQIATLKPLLEEQFFDGESVWIMFLLPLLCGLLLYCLLLVVWAKYEDWIDSVPWPAEWIEWGESVQSLFHECGKEIVRIMSQLSELERHFTRTSASRITEAAPAVTPIEPPQKPPETVFSPFGATEKMHKEGFIWDERNEIE